MNQIKTGKDFYDKLGHAVVDGLNNMKKPVFDPTGALEPAIVAVGNFTGFLRVVNLQCNNKGGKSAIGAQIVSNIIWEHDPRFFNYPNYIEWPFKDNNNNTIKQGRIIGSSENVKDNGPITLEIEKWWPRGRYKRYKHKKEYYCLYETDNGWLIDVMTFKQDPKDFEGPVKSWHWIDEPAKAELMGAITSRHYKGGIIFITQTPIGAAPMLDILSDLNEKGTDVVKITSTLDDNSSETGKLNSLGTRRGLMTNYEIEQYKMTVPPDEYNARVLGIGSEKEGKIYRSFNRDVHVRDFDINDRRFRLANCYMALDYHQKLYPFISWWAVFPPNEIGRSYNVCYNEWPTFETFGKYYDEVRPSLQFDMTLDKLSKLMKIMDNSHEGYNIIKRGIDPWFDDNKAVQAAMLPFDINLLIPQRETVEVKRNELRTLMEWDDKFGVENLNIYTEPGLFVMPHCKNMIRSFERHYWEDNERLKRSRTTEVEADRYKDPIDTARIFRSLLGNTEYIPISPGGKIKRKRNKVIQTIEDECFQKMSSTCLFRQATNAI